MCRVLVLGRNSLSSKLLVKELMRAGYHVLWYAEKRDDRYSLIKRRVAKYGLFGVLSQLFFQGFQRLLYRASYARVKQIAENFDELNAIQPIATISNVNDQGFLNALCGSFDIVVLSGTRILSSSTLAFFKGISIINIHAGITPKYRGVHGGYWALASRDSGNFGSTIHYVDSGIDTGEVIQYVRMQPDKNDNFCTYPLLQQKASVQVLAKILPRIIRHEISGCCMLSESRIWTHPTIFQYFINYFKYGVK